MPTVILSSTTSIGGISTSSARSFQVDSVINNSPNETVPASIAGVLTTRSTETTGIITSVAHGLLDTDTIAVYWGATSYRYDVDIDSVTTDTITISGGAGTVLPDQDDVVNVSNVLQIDFKIDGDNLKALMAGGNKRTVSSYLDGSVVSQFAVEMQANERFVWYNGNGYTNPLAGVADVDAINIYNLSAEVSTYSLVSGIDNSLDQI